MKILRISLCNLASLEGTHTIDFGQEPLASAGLFAITGATGAGKSTLLDAMCLALYGKTPRLTAAKGTKENMIGNEMININDPRSILRRGCGAGWAQVDFVAVDGKTYQARWSVKRAHKSAAEKLMNAEMEAVCIDTRTPLQGTKTEIQAKIETLVGLKYEQFTRTVLLAQNDFASFLKADENTKADLLEKLTDTDIFSRISIRVYEQNKLKQSQMDELRAKLDGIRLLTDDEMNALQADLDKALNDTERCRRELDETNARIAWHDEAAKITKLCEQARAEMERCQTEALQAAERRERLADIEAAQHSREIVAHIDNARKNIAQNNNALIANRKDITTNEASAQKAEAERAAAGEKMQACVEEATAMAGQLKEARALDARIEAEALLARQRTDEHEAQRNKADEAEKSAQSAQNALTEIIRKLNAETAMVESMKSRAELFANVQTVVEKLNQAKAARRTATEHVQKAKQAQDQMVEHEKTRSENDRQTENLRARVDELTQKSDKAGEELRRTDIGQLQENLQLAQQEATRLKMTLMLACEFAAKSADANAIKSEISITCESIDAIRKELDAAQDRLAQARADAEKCDERLKTARQFATENIRLLRMSLTEDEPCPVCGSTHHPDAEKLVDDVLKQREAESKTADARRAEAEKAASDLQNRLNASTNRKEQIEKRLLQLGGELDRTRAKAAELKIDIEAESVENLTDAERRANSESERLKMQITDWQRKNEDLQKCNGLLTRTQNELSEAQRKSQECALKVSQLKAEMESAQKTAADEMRRAAECLDDAGRFFSRQEWKENWESAPDEFVKTLKTKAAEYDEHQKNANALAAEAERLKTAAEAAGKAANEAGQAAAECAQRLKAQLETLSNLKEKRKALLGGREADDVERGLERNKAAAQKALDDCTEQCTTIRNERDRMEGIVQQLNSSIATQQDELNEASAQLEKWLGNFNVGRPRSIDEAGLRQLLQHDNQFIENERIALDKIRHSLTMAEAQLAGAQERQSAHHNRPDRPTAEQTAERLAEQATKIRQESAQIDERRIGIRTTMEQQKSNQRLHAERIAELEKMQSSARLWQTMAATIGSAKGDTFRRIAQSYTLQSVIGYANRHLQSLSGRYELRQIPDTMNIKVVDHDMCDEERSANSLSGGESFLVSLALALGLSSLTGSNLNVESLFIDEGFGSLDSRSLDTVMEALERLQMQGRKIGVISHIGEMQERMNVSICVCKNGRGRSGVKIVSK